MYIINHFFHVLTGHRENLSDSNEPYAHENTERIPILQDNARTFLLRSVGVSIILLIWIRHVSTE